MVLTAGKLNDYNMNGSGIVTGGVLTAGSLKNAFHNAGVHPDLIEHLAGGGFFGTLFDAVKKGTKFVLDNKDTIANVAMGAKAGYDAYKKSKGGALVAVSSKNLGRHKDSIYHEEYLENQKSKQKAKRPQTAWNKLVTKITKQEKCNVSEAIKFIKANNLY